MCENIQLVFALLRIGIYSVSVLLTLEGNLCKICKVSGEGTHLASFLHDSDKQSENFTWALAGILPCLVAIWFLFVILYTISAYFHVYIKYPNTSQCFCVHFFISCMKNSNSFQC